MSTTTIAAVMREGRLPVELEPIQLDELKPDEVLVRTRASGICHTDLFARERVALPAVLGHEGAGFVEAIGRNVTRVALGARVIVSYPSCGRCPGCAENAPYSCEMHMPLAFAGTRLDKSKTMRLENGEALFGAFFQQSSFAKHLITTERSVVPVDSDVPMERLAALACGVQTGAGAVLNTFKLGPMHGLAVFGVGAVGMSALLAAKLSGASPIIAVDVLEPRLALARDLGATHALNAQDGSVAERIRGICPAGVHYTLETSGNATSLEEAIASLRAGGECGMVISPNFGQKYPFSPSSIFTRGASLRGIIQGSAVPSTFLPRLLELNARGLFPYERLITTYHFADIDRAMVDMKAGAVIKPVVLIE